MPYGFYMFLRLVAVVVFGWAAIVSADRKHSSLPWVFGFIAVLFNPIVKFPFPKEVWAFIDVGAGLLLLVTKQHFEQLKPK